MQRNIRELEEKQKNALQRISELRAKIESYLQEKAKIPDGISCWEEITQTQKRLQEQFGIGEREWNDWHWQIKNRVSTPQQLSELISLNEQQEQDVAAVCQSYRFAISLYYLSLMGNTSACPIRIQAIPSYQEISDTVGMIDPMAEESGSPVPAVVQRYPDRIIINVTNRCAMYCRHCQRRRLIGQRDSHSTINDLTAALEYVRQQKQIRDVLLTGGDALMLEDDLLDWLLTELERIPHVEIKRIGTRVPVTLPMRITDNLCQIMSRHLPLYLNTQFNHPLEITPAAAEACLKLARSGVALGNQSVLLAGVNDDVNIIKKLNQMLLTIMVRPYYLFHAKPVQGTQHFRTQVEKGIEIIRGLRGSTSGLAIPTFVVNAPGGLGKIALYPECIVEKNEGEIVLRTWEGKLIKYQN